MLWITSRSQAETVYEVARAAQTGYEWLTEKVTLFLRLREEFRSKWKNAGATQCTGVFQVRNGPLQRHIHIDVDHRIALPAAQIKFEPAANQPPSRI